MFATLLLSVIASPRRRQTTRPIAAAESLESRALLSAAAKVAPANFTGHWHVHNGSSDIFELTITQSGRKVTASSDVDFMQSEVTQFKGKVKGDHIILRGRTTTANGSKYQLTLNADKTTNIHFEGSLLVALKNGSTGSYNADGELVIPV